MAFFIIDVQVRINITELHLNINREGRPRGVAPTVRSGVWWRNWWLCKATIFYVHFYNDNDHGKSFISFWIATARQGAHSQWLGFILVFIKMQLFFSREGRPSQQVGFGVAPTVRTYDYWHNLWLCKATIYNPRKTPHPALSRRGRGKGASHEIAGRDEVPARNDAWWRQRRTAKPPRSPSDCPFLKGAMTAHGKTPSVPIRVPLFERGNEGASHEIAGRSPQWRRQLVARLRVKPAMTTHDDGNDARQKPPRSPTECPFWKGAMTMVGDLF
jgi:hypothetical protein